MSSTRCKLAVLDLVLAALALPCAGCDVLCALLPWFPFCQASSTAGVDFGDVDHVTQDGLTSGKTPAETVEMAVNYLKTMPNVADAGLTTFGDGAWAALKTGGYEVVLFPPIAFGDEWKRVSQATTVPPALPRVAGPAREPDMPKTGYCPTDPMIFGEIFSFGSLAGANTNDYFNMLVMAEYRRATVFYSGANSGGYGSIEWFKTINQYSLLYLYEVSVTIPVNGRIPGVETLWGLMTTDQVTPEKTKALSADIKAGRIIVGKTAASFDSMSRRYQWEGRYFITQLFLQQHLTGFEEGSVVYIDGCATWDENEGSMSNSPLIDCLMGKKALVMGWNSTPTYRGASRAAHYFFSRMLGYNGFPTATPPNRPHRWISVTYQMYQRGLDQTPILLIPGTATPIPASGKAMLDGDEDFQDWSTNEPQWRPAIRSVAVTQSGPSFADQLYLEGEFPETQEGVEIMVADRPVDIVEWQDWGVKTSIDPNNGGDVVMKVRGIPSNAVPLSEWKGTFTLRGRMWNNGPTLDLTMALGFRGDIHPRRLLGDPDTAVHDLSTMLAVGANPETTGIGQWSVTGEHTSGRSKWVWSGQGQLFSDSTKHAHSSGQIRFEEPYKAKVQFYVNGDLGCSGGVPCTGGAFYHEDYYFDGKKVSESDRPLSYDYTVTTFATSAGVTGGATMFDGGLTLSVPSMSPSSAPNGNTPG